MSSGVADVNENARSALDCGGSTPPWNFTEEEDRGGVEPPQSKASVVREGARLYITVGLRHQVNALKIEKRGWRCGESELLLSC